jgi:hypothetical protein
MSIDIWFTMLRGMTYVVAIMNYNRSWRILAFQLGKVKLLRN